MLNIISLMITRLSYIAQKIDTFRLLMFGAGEADNIMFGDGADDEILF